MNTTIKFMDSQNVGDFHSNSAVHEDWLGSSGGASVCETGKDDSFAVSSDSYGWGGGYIELFAPRGNIIIHGFVEANGGGTRNQKNYLGMGGGAGSGGSGAGSGAGSDSTSTSYSSTGGLGGGSDGSDASGAGSCSASRTAAWEGASGEEREGAATAADEKEKEVLRAMASAGAESGVAMGAPSSRSACSAGSAPSARRSRSARSPRSPRPSSTRR